MCAAVVLLSRSELLKEVCVPEVECLAFVEDQLVLRPFQIPSSTVTCRIVPGEDDGASGFVRASATMPVTMTSQTSDSTSSQV